jgi:hypothetical protein
MECLLLNSQHSIVKGKISLVGLLIMEVLKRNVPATESGDNFLRDGSVFPQDSWIGFQKGLPDLLVFKGLSDQVFTNIGIGWFHTGIRSGFSDVGLVFSKRTKDYIGLFVCLHKDRHIIYFF